MSDIRKPDETVGPSPYRYIDVMNKSLLEQVIVEQKIDWVIHFSALLSAIGEKFMDKALAVNIVGFQNVIELGWFFILFLFQLLEFSCSDFHFSFH